MFPKQVNIREVGPRDGLQNEKFNVPLKAKVELINRLNDCFFNYIEIGSFVSPKWIPQMEDTENLIKLIKKKPNTIYPYLVPNIQGLSKALDKGIKNICVFTTASESFSKKNTNCNIEESLIRIKNIFQIAKKENITVRGYISCVLGCPYEGKIDFRKIANLSEKLINLGCYEVSLGDTVGYGTPNKVNELIKEVKKKLDVNQIAVHFHDTYGQALANIYAALQLGIKNIDSSVGGLGGCPYAKGAKGNVATEDVVYMLNGMGIKTGIDLKQVVKTAHFIYALLKKPPASRVAVAMK
tara:strand:+ start:507 stop:1397 length:891 start_codon:yes stop_codon:yes gene_type:complete